MALVEHKLGSTDMRVPIKPYAPDPDGLAQRRFRRYLFIAVIAFCAFYGLAFAVLAPVFIIVFTVPIAILGAFTIWALPTISNPPTKSLERLFFIFLIASVTWPNYLALALPGLPWITIARLTGVPLSLALLVCLSVSRAFRASLVSVLRATPTVWKLILAFVFIEFMTIPLSTTPGRSLDLAIVYQTSWTGVFFASCYIFAKPGRVERWAIVVWTMAIVVSLIGVAEHHFRRILWAGHIPKILQIEDPNVIFILAGNMRAYTNVYRVQSTFGGPIQMGEFISLIVPFVLHFAVTDRRIYVKACAISSIPLLLWSSYQTHSRSGLVGFILASLLYTLYWGGMRWRNQRSSVIGPAVTLGFPALGLLAASLILTMGRLRKAVLGSGAEKSSTDARAQQYHIGIPKILSHPLGHGAGTAGDVLGWVDPSGRITVDTYYLTIGLDFGILGFLVFFGMFAVSIYYSCRNILANAGVSGEEAFLGPATISIVNFVIIKGVFSQADNHQIVFMILGMSSALAYRIHERARTMTSDSSS